MGNWAFRSALRYFTRCRLRTLFVICLLAIAVWVSLLAGEARWTEDFLTKMSLPSLSRYIKRQDGNDKSPGAPSGDGRRFEERRRHLENICQTLRFQESSQDSRMRLILHRPLNFAFCTVPKIGSSFLKRILHALKYKKTDITNVTIPMANKTPLDTIRSMKTFTDAYASLSKATRVLFVREPYARLLSGYRDKFFINDLWRGMRQKIIKTIHLKPGNASDVCHELTFDEFLQFALTVGREERYSGPNEHWFPIMKLCHPCSFDFHIIGKHETFSDDVHYVLDKMGNISAILGKVPPPEALAKDQIRNMGGIFKQRKCLPRIDIARRLWQLYIDYGYIHYSYTFPEKLITTNTSVERLVGLALEAYSVRPMTSTERAQQRHDGMVRAYSEVSMETLAQIPDVFRMDFELFDYTLKPDYLFCQGPDKPASCSGE